MWHLTKKVHGKYCGINLWTRLAKIDINIMFGVRPAITILKWLTDLLFKTILSTRIITRVHYWYLRWHPFFIGSLIVTTIFYWTSAGLYAIMDFTQWPKFLMKYKIQPDKNVPLDPKRFLKVLSLIILPSHEHRLLGAIIYQIKLYCANLSI